MKNKPADKAYCCADRNRILSSHPSLYPDMMDLFKYYLKERYSIHIKKDVLREPAPWTEDDIFQSYRFTNVRREDDKQTRWVINNIAGNDELTYENKLLNCIMFRLYNWYNTAELLGIPIKFSDSPLDPEDYRETLSDAVSSGERIFTGVFNVSGLKKGLRKYCPKNTPMEMRPLYFMAQLQKDNLVRKLKLCGTPIMVCSLLARYCGIGWFLAYQIFVDMTYIEEFPFSENEFTLAGPGCIKGIDFLFDDMDFMSYEDCVFWLRNYLNELPENDPVNPRNLFKGLPNYDQTWNVMCVENCLCEFSKYVRIFDGTGKARTAYNGGKS